MAAKHRHWLAWLGVLVGSCAADADPQTLGQYTGEMQVAIDGMQAELALHRETMAQWDPDAVYTLEWQHMENFYERLARMESAHDGVATCGQHMMRAHNHAGMAPLMAKNAAMDDLHGEAYREFGRHAYAMDLAQTADQAIAEESEHARIMDELVVRFSAHCESMLVALDDMGDRASLECPAYTRVPAR